MECLPRKVAVNLDPDQERGHIGDNQQGCRDRVPKFSGAHTTPPHVLDAKHGCTGLIVFPSWVLLLSPPSHSQHEQVP
jgi:hypothetical protein